MAMPKKPKVTPKAATGKKKTVYRVNVMGKPGNVFGTVDRMGNRGSRGHKVK